MNQNEVTLEVLVRSWHDAKREEEEAVLRRRAIAKQIVDLLPKQEEGTERRDFGNLRLVVQHKLTRSVDARLANEWQTLTPQVQASFRWKPDVDLKNLRALEFAAPDQYAIAARYITTKPATPSVDVEEIK